MAGEKNFNVKNGLSVGGVEVVDSSGDLVAGALGTTAIEVIDDHIANTLLTAGTGVSLTYNDSAGTLTINGQQGDITGVNAGAGLTGTATSGDATLNIGAGTGITVNADDIAVDMTAVRASIDGSDLDMGGNKVLFANVYSAEGDLPSASTYHGMFAHVHGTGAGYFAHAGAWKKLLDESSSDTADLTEGTNLYYTDSRADARITNALVDEDNMASNSDIKIPSQQSVKAYVDAQIQTKDNSDEIVEGSTNLYHTSERVADVVGGMVSSNTESGIGVTYDDADNTLDFTVGTLNQNTTGNAATVTNGVYTTGAQTIAGVKTFSSTIVGDLTGDVTGNISGSAGTATGNAGSATVLESARTIGGVSFDGSANINLAGVNTAGTVDTSGNAATATALETARTIHGVSFDGTGNIDLSEVVQDTVGAMFTSNTESGITVAYQDGDGTVDFTVGTLNQSTTGNADTATALENSRTIQGVAFDGSANITTMTAGTGVGVSGTAVSIGQAVATSDKPSFAGVTLTGNSDVTGNIVPTVDDTYDLGSASKAWKDVYIGPGSLYVNGQKVVEDNSGTITVSADVNQNVAVSTSGSGDIELSPTGTGQVEIKGPMQITASKAISSSDGNAIAFSNSIDVDAIESRSTDTNLTLSANGTGIVTVADALTVTGNLTVSGTTTTVNSETINLADNIIVLNSDFTSGTPSEDTGFSVLRGGSATKSFIWDESEDKWSVGSETMVAGTFEGNLTGNVTGNTSGSSGSTTGNAATATSLATARTIAVAGDVSGSASFDGTGNISITTTVADDSHNHTVANVDSLQGFLDAKYQSGSNAALGTITTTNASNSGAFVRNIHQSTSAPSSGAGAVGDLWVLYS
jgi:hypothetical protein